MLPRWLWLNHSRSRRTSPIGALVKHWSGAAALEVMKSFAGRGTALADADVVQIFTAMSVVHDQHYSLHGLVQTRKKLSKTLCYSGRLAPSPDAGSLPLLLMIMKLVCVCSESKVSSCRDGLTFRLRRALPHSHKSAHRYCQIRSRRTAEQSVILKTSGSRRPPVHLRRGCNEASSHRFLRSNA
jgi:hypothetical protein